MTFTRPDHNSARRRPEGPLRRFVQSFWCAQSGPSRRERIPPTASSSAVFILDTPSPEAPNDPDDLALRATQGFFFGPHDRAILRQSPADTRTVGILTTPVGCEAILGISPARWRGQVVDLTTVWPAAALLHPQLADAGSPERIFDILEEYLTSHMDASSPGLDRCEQGVAMLEGDPTRPIAEIAAELNLSPGHMDRELTHLVGLTPRALARMLRLHRVVDAIGTGDPVTLAADFGWANYEEFLRDFKRHTGMFPLDYMDWLAKHSPVEATQGRVHGD